MKKENFVIVFLLFIVHIFQQEYFWLVVFRHYLKPRGVEYDILMWMAGINLVLLLLIDFSLVSLLIWLIRSNHPKFLEEKLVKQKAKQESKLLKKQDKEHSVLESLKKELTDSKKELSDSEKEIAELKKQLKEKEEKKLNEVSLREEIIGE